MNKKNVGIVLTGIFLVSLCAVTTACGGKKKSAVGPKVKSGSGMGNQKHKNKHVWGK